MDEAVKRFKIGFLTKLAEQGITPSEFVVSLTKLAMDPVDLFSRIAGGAGSAGQGAMSAGLGAGISGLKTLGYTAALAPAVLGAGAGILTEKMESPDPEAVKQTMQKAEMIGLYRRLAREARNRRDTHNHERVV